MIMMVCGVIPGSTVNTHNEVACDLGVQCSTVASFVHSEDSLNPSHDLMRGGVGRLVQVYDSQPDILGDGPLQGSRACWDWGIVAGLHVQLVVVLEQEGPF